MLISIWRKKHKGEFIDKFHVYIFFKFYIQFSYADMH